MREVAVMFSGGIDSSYLVTRLDGLFDRIRLVTFDVPYSIRKRVPSVAAEQLARICQRSEVTHEYLEMSDTAKHIRGGLLQAEIDNRNVGHAYSWCLGCKFAMYSRMVMFARENGITEVADGAKGNDIHAAEQSPEAVALVDELFGRYGLKHASPVYDDYDAPQHGYWARRMKLDDDNALGRRRLRELGFRMPPQILNQDRLIQPFCGVALVLNILRLVRRERPGATTRYYRLKEPLIDDAIRRELR